jgi:ATP-dependent Lhr-like helicase
LGRLRREIEPVSAADFVRFLFRWQHVAPGTLLHGASGALQILKQLQGYEISAAAWESEVLKRRIARYDAELLDRLCLNGEVMWGRLSPHPAFEDARPGREAEPPSRRRAGRRIRPTRVAPVAIFLREDSGWLLEASAASQTSAREAISHAAREILQQLETRGASFLSELVRVTGRLASEVEDGLWELVAGGLVTADGFDNLRAFVNPKRRRGEGRFRAARPRHAAGRWALLRGPRAGGLVGEPMGEGVARRREDTLEAFGRQLLVRWGVVFRDVVAREAIAPPWRELLGVLRRLEARGEIRGGRFVSGFLGEQFARPEAVELLRAVRRDEQGRDALRVSTADPLNLVGIITPGSRISAIVGGTVDLLAGCGASALTRVAR